MTGQPVFIISMGMVSALGASTADSAASLDAERSLLAPLTLFGAGPGGPLPVAEIAGTAEIPTTADPPRTHLMARQAAAQALNGHEGPLDAIVIGVTTGGMPATETALEQGIDDPSAYRWHGVGTVAEDLARHYGCNGPVLSLSTACASGATAIAMAAAMIRRGVVRRVLAGGADALCRLTYFGFKSLQVIDPEGAKPLDRDRRGMSLGEGAAMLLLADTPGEETDLMILGTGLSCDAHHPSTPHPEGAGALTAMQAALADAGLTPDAVDYINLHGTGTPDNDRAEALAIRRLFGDSPPPLSSTKGFTGHTLGAAGALEAAIAGIAIENGRVPGNVGTRTVDPDLGIDPVRTTTPLPVVTVLSNSFGFGGNNAALLIGRRQAYRPSPGGVTKPLVVDGYACLSGKGRTADTLAALSDHSACRGSLADAALCQDLDPRGVRRLKRLSKMALALAEELRRKATDLPRAISMGTGWGALSETHDFITRLMETGYQFPSPMDFIGSVHNAPAGQVAMLLGARGANLTATGGNYSFEQALLAADMATNAASGPTLVMGIDEAHAKLTPRFDPSAAGGAELSDGGGALIVRRGAATDGIQIALAGYHANATPEMVAAVLTSLGGAGGLNRRFGVILAGLPAAHRGMAQNQLDRFIGSGDFTGPVIDFRQLTGEFATATAIATVAAVHWVTTDTVVRAPGTPPQALNGKGVLVLGLGPSVTAITIYRP